MQQESQEIEQEIKRIKIEIRENESQRKIEELKRLIQIEKDRVSLIKNEQDRITEAHRSKLRARVEAEKRKLKQILKIDPVQEF